MTDKSLNSISFFTIRLAQRLSKIDGAYQSHYKIDIIASNIYIISLQGDSEIAT
jgi:hypothetical protein